MLLFAQRTSDVAPWEAPIAVMENHTEASCPVMIDGETNGLWSSIICETNSEWEGASPIIHSQTVWLRQGTANAAPLCSGILRSLIKLEVKFTNPLNADAVIVTA